ncbi:MAG: enoyl-CoA hydratase, partial [Flavobacteriia bacterium]|nr:enoyl-CoA hydratase [Flavobacteriia bacterium]
MQDSQILLSDLSETGVLRLTLNGPKRRNALSEAMLTALSAAFETAGSSPDVRVIILAANGPAFCAGHDLKELTAGRQAGDRGKAYFAKIMAMCSGVMQSIVACPKPVIAEVTGIATAAGCQLVASCDLAVAASTAQFSTPGVHIGLFCSTPMVALSRNVSNKHAMEMLLTGDPITAVQAAQKGIITQSLEGAELAKHVLEKANKIASKSSKTL